MLELTDRIELAPLVELTPDGIVDHATGARYPTNPSASAVLAHPGSLGTAAHALAARWGVDESTARDDVLRFAWALNRQALVNIVSSTARRTRWIQTVALAFRLAPLGRVPRTRVRRRAVDTTSVASVVRAVVRALVGRVVAFAFCSGAAFGASALVVSLGSARSPGTVAELGTVAAGVGMATAAGLLLHEVGHLAALRGVPAVLVIARGRTSVLHPAVTALRQVAVAVAGPALPGVAGVALAAGAYASSDPGLAFAACPLWGHAASATVGGRDGRNALGLGPRAVANRPPIAHPAGMPERVLPAARPLSNNRKDI